ncbi:hypothetical protein A2867_00335 [Candidatus Daviesbacteria bacterium RIFCSPHIGHO2_01_FULL_40_11]|uniref:Uncharacterized protein n=1 Tax=Candidatus Daviesbacteria bacterium RIFCSPHIGHO2_01_FULL_40_11 TaxID=1797762 RepID=A0A1F5JLU2_9BACT|nr:MAG: hypothetical protein A2867_00335 [Candidatus Daviesbacteria bacterium RIFCSPHIGHO2_01_FULL_40_11]OGE62606.1 MAG: hypothetical protein A2964_00225 [Candidatus Daviesbacteria bacterium RIFCSPLOWO2_01_FULL_40_27]
MNRENGKDRGFSPEEEGQTPTEASNDYLRFMRKMVKWGAVGLGVGILLTGLGLATHNGTLLSAGTLIDTAGFFGVCTGGFGVIYPKVEKKTNAIALKAYEDMNGFIEGMYSAADKLIAIFNKSNQPK